MFFRLTGNEKTAQPDDWTGDFDFCAPQNATGDRRRRERVIGSAVYLPSRLASSQSNILTDRMLLLSLAESIKRLKGLRMKAAAIAAKDDLCKRIVYDIQALINVAGAIMDSPPFAPSHPTTLNGRRR